MHTYTLVVPSINQRFIQYLNGGWPWRIVSYLLNFSGYSYFFVAQGIKMKTKFPEERWWRLSNEIVMWILNPGRPKNRNLQPLYYCNIIFHSYTYLAMISYHLVCGWAILKSNLNINLLASLLDENLAVLKMLIFSSKSIACNVCNLYLWLWLNIYTI